jgi:dTDP-glucose pyrophosphorylase
MKIVVPMAGKGSRFVQAGYALPKPLIDVGGKPMISRVIENLPFDAEFIFLARKEHLESYTLEAVLKESTNGRCQIVSVDQYTEGAACTVLLAEEFINSGESVMISNCDELMGYEVDNFLTMVTLEGNTGDFIWVFKDPSRNPKWSFALTDAGGRVVEVAEKNPISEYATCGVYYWGQGHAFVSCAEDMINKDIRVNGEFYVCPVYNEGIRRGRQVYPFFVTEMWGLGTPEDLNAYLSRR